MSIVMSNPKNLGPRNSVFLALSILLDISSAMASWATFLDRSSMASYSPLVDVGKPTISTDV